MKELKILAVVIFFTLLTYWGVEPFAHSQMHPHTDDADFTFKDLSKNEKAGDATNGMTLATSNCIGCHAIKSQGFESPMGDTDASGAYGVVPPDLSNIGYLYDATYLSELIKNPPKAMKLRHKFGDKKPHPMTAYFPMQGDDMDKEVADIVAYFQSIAPKEMEDKAVYIDACGRCHSVKYDGFHRNSLTDSLEGYMGTNPPDLSIIIRAKGHEYLEKFINDPQKLLHGTSMPRVGIKQEPQEQVIKYLESVGDRKKAERESLGVNLVIFMVIFSVFALLWKKSMWRDLH